MKEFLTYILIIRKRLWLVLLLPISAAGTVIGVSYLNPPVYLAWARFQVTAPPPVDVTLFQGGGYRSAGDQILATRAEFVDILTSTSVAWEVIDKLGLPMNAGEFLELVSVEEVVSEQFQSQAQLTRVAVKAGDAESAALLTNTLVEVGLKQYGEVRARSKTMSREFIQSQLEATEQKLRELQAQLIAFQIENKVGDLPQVIVLQEQLIYKLSDSRDQAQAAGNLEQVANFEQLILQREVELQSLITLSAEYADLAAAVKQAESTVEFLSEKETEAELKENETLNIGFVQVISTVRPPSAPLPQVQKAILALSIVVSLVVGVIIAFIWHYIETSAEAVLANMDHTAYQSTNPSPETL